jgi:hypothetical protein
MGSFMSKIRVSRMIDGEEKAMATIKLFIDLSNSGNRKNFKLF